MGEWPDEREAVIPSVAGDLLCGSPAPAKKVPRCARDDGCMDRPTVVSLDRPLALSSYRLIVLDRPHYSDDRNATSAARCSAENPCTRSRACCASPPCHITASSSDRARPSCMKLVWPLTVWTRPIPQSGAVRHSLPVAWKSDRLSARPAPMSWTS